MENQIFTKEWWKESLQLDELEISPPLPSFKLNIPQEWNGKLIHDNKEKDAILDEFAKLNPNLFKHVDIEYIKGILHGEGKHYDSVKYPILTTMLLCEGLQEVLFDKFQQDDRYINTSEHWTSFKNLIVKQFDKRIINFNDINQFFDTHKEINELQVSNPVADFTVLQKDDDLEIDAGDYIVTDISKDDGGYTFTIKNTATDKVTSDVYSDYILSTGYWKSLTHIKVHNKKLYQYIDDFYKQLDELEVNNPSPTPEIIDKLVTNNDDSSVFKNGVMDILLRDFQYPGDWNSWIKDQDQSTLNKLYRRFKDYQEPLDELEIKNPGDNFKYLPYKEQINNEIKDQISNFLSSIQNEWSNNKTVFYVMIFDNEGMFNQYIKEQISKDEDYEVENPSTEDIIEYIKEHPDLSQHIAKIIWKFYWDVLDIDDIKSKCYKRINDHIEDYNGYIDKHDIKNAVRYTLEDSQIYPDEIFDDNSDELMLYLRNMLLGSQTQKLDESQQPSRTDLAKQFIKYCVEYLKLTKIPKIKFTTTKEETQTYAHYDPANDTIVVYTKGRSLGDILRSLSHELVHAKQRQNNELNADSGETGSPAEDEANAEAGVLLRNFGEKYPMIFEGKINELEITNPNDLVIGKKYDVESDVTIGKIYHGAAYIGKTDEFAAFSTFNSKYSIYIPWDKRFKLTKLTNKINELEVTKPFRVWDFSEKYIPNFNWKKINANDTIKYHDNEYKVKNNEHHKIDQIDSDNDIINVYDEEDNIEFNLSIISLININDRNQSPKLAELEIKNPAPTKKQLEDELITLLKQNIGNYTNDTWGYILNDPEFIDRTRESLLDTIPSQVHDDPIVGGQTFGEEVALVALKLYKLQHPKINELEITNPAPTKEEVTKLAILLNTGVNGAAYSKIFIDLGFDVIRDKIGTFIESLPQSKLNKLYQILKNWESNNNIEESQLFTKEWWKESLQLDELEVNKPHLKLIPGKQYIVFDIHGSRNGWNAIYDHELYDDVDKDTFYIFKSKDSLFSVSKQEIDSGDVKIEPYKLKETVVVTSDATRDSQYANIKSAVEKTIKGFKMQPTNRGFKNSYVNSNGKATPLLASQMTKFLHNRLGVKNVKFVYEGTYGTVMIVKNKLNELEINNPTIRYTPGRENSNINEFEKGKNINITIYNCLKANPYLSEGQIQYILTKRIGWYSSYKIVGDAIRHIENIDRKQVQYKNTNRKIYVYYINDKPINELEVNKPPGIL